MDPLDGLNTEQRRAAEAVHGPVCILAGAGSGKTTTITRRIARQVASGAFRADELLAVTFTDKAAGELKQRLRALGVDGVEARTFHSAALAQLHRYTPGSVGRILPSKALPLRRIANRLPRPYRFRAAADLATEIERAKNRRIPPGHYLQEAGSAAAPLPPDLMHRVYVEYERGKEAAGLVDFEDLLERAIVLFETDEHARTDLRDRYSAFTVDEYQDVNLLQQTLLQLWLGERDELCVVGDDYQSIYSFTGASPEWLLGMRTRFPHAFVATLEDNYRSSPQVLELANRLVPQLGGAPKTLRATRPDDAEPIIARFASADAEGTWIVERIRELGVALEQVAILCRTNARLTDFESLLHDAGIPYQGSSLLEREAARRIVKALRGDGSTGVAARVRRLAAEAGWAPVLPAGLGEREQTRQSDLGRIVTLADELDDGALTGAGFVDELRRRFDSGGEHARGVHLLTLHRAKGLEFEAVFLPRLEEKELPVRAARSDAEVAEERRLLYVGLTRAKRHLFVSCAGKASRFLRELEPNVPGEPGVRARSDWSPLAQRLRDWRRERALREGIPAFVVFHDTVLHSIADARPASLDALSQISGIGPAKLERYGEELLATLDG